MNTPKLLSIISSSAGNAEQARAARAADRAHGLDFSQLLGERRAQSAALAETRPSYADTQRRNPERASTPEPSAPARNDNAARQSGSRNTPATRADANASARADERRVARQDNGAAAAGARSETPDPSHASADSGRPASIPGTDQTAGAGTTETTGRPGQAGDTEASAELALNAAEAGLTGLMAAHGADTASGTGALEAATARPPVAAAAPQPGLPPGKAATDAPDTPALASLAAEAATIAALDPARPAGAQQAVAQPVAAANTAPTPPLASTPVAAAAPDTPAHSPAADDAPLLTGTAPPIDAATSAATRSLQDFTAMVAAARATSGTVLAASTAPGPASPALPGLMPGGLFAAQQPPTNPLASAPGIPAPLGSPRWATEFGQQFIRIAQAGAGLGQVAELRLDPPELGPLRITINLNDNVAHAVFSSPHASVRQTVENALPQLQQMLEQAGISLGQANVNDQGRHGQEFQGEARHAASQAAGPGTTGGSSATDPGGHGATARRTADPDALVDTFA